MFMGKIAEQVLAFYHCGLPPSQHVLMCQSQNKTVHWSGISGQTCFISFITTVKPGHIKQRGSSKSNTPWSGQKTYV